MKNFGDENNSKNVNQTILLNGGPKQLIEDKNKLLSAVLIEESDIVKQKSNVDMENPKEKNVLDGSIFGELTSMETLNDLENLLEKSDSSEKRIKELENALRETILISTEREEVLQNEEKKRKNIMQKVFKLEQRLLSLQTAQAMRCHSCNQYVQRMANLQSRLSRLLSERKENLKELNRMKMDALESAISEKDAHLAFIEINGIRTAKQADEAEKLQLDKRRLMERLKKENEISMSLCKQDEIDDNSDLSDDSND